MKFVPNMGVSLELEREPEFQALLYDAAEEVRKQAAQLNRTPVPHPGFWSQTQWRWAFWSGQPWAMERAVASQGGPRIRYRRLPERSHEKRKRHPGRFAVTQDPLTGTQVWNLVPTAIAEEYGGLSQSPRAPLRRGARAAGLKFRRSPIRAATGRR